MSTKLSQMTIHSKNCPHLVSNQQDWPTALQIALRKDLLAILNMNPAATIATKQTAGVAYLVPAKYPLNHRMMSTTPLPYWTFSTILATNLSQTATYSLDSTVPTTAS